MKIGILGCGFNCKEYINDTIAPWIYEKENNKEHTFCISIAYGIFAEYVKMYKNNNKEIVEDGTLSILRNFHNESKIDNIFSYSESEMLSEAEARTGALKYLLDEKCDIIWLVDLYDEVYTQENIHRIIKFIQKHNSYDYYRINFKNYVFDKHHYIEGFNPSRIFWTNRNSGIKKFVWDNDIEYNNGVQHMNTSGISIDPKYVMVNHYSWCGSKEYLKNKIEYQNMHFNGNCSYIWNNELNRLDFNDEFYAKYNIKKPVVIKE